MKFEPKHIVLKNGKEIIIREAASGDAERLIAAAKCYLRESDYLLSYEDEFNPTIEEEAAWVKSMDSENSLLLVATHNNDILSTFSLQGRQFRKLKHTAEIAIAIRKEWQRIGLGKALFDSAIEWCKNESLIEILYLDVFASNIHAYSLYKKVGFIEDGRRKGYYKTIDGKYIDNIMMSLKIK